MLKDLKLSHCQLSLALLLYVFSGTDVKEFFQNESGGHRWQRTPPTETKGRVHTSVVTVAIVEKPSMSTKKLNPKEVGVMTTMGSGPGGQHRNRTYSCVTLTHKPTGIKVREDGRSQAKNKEKAMAELQNRVDKHYNSLKRGYVDNNRKEQVGNGSRSERIRTYNTKNNRVVNHENGKKMALSQLYRGGLKKIH